MGNTEKEIKILKTLQDIRLDVADLYKLMNQKSKKEFRRGLLLGILIGYIITDILLVLILYLRL